MLETSHPPVYYIPPEDVRVDYLQASSRGSWCEWKGQAVYYSLVTPNTTCLDSVWSYPNPQPAEAEILGAIPYQANDIVLHTDNRLLPRARRAWASWNYHRSGSEQPSVTLTYNLNRLQGHRSDSSILETLNPSMETDPERVLDRLTYDHPVYSVRTIDAQRRFDEINGHRRTYYCGAYWGFGFHEDGVRSALAVASCFGKSLESCIAVST